MVAKKTIKPQSVQLAYEDYERLLQIEQEFLGQKEQQVKKRHVLRGLAELADYFKSSITTVWRMKNEEWFRPALVQHGRTILVDADLAWDLACKHSHKCVYGKSKPEISDRDAEPEE